MRDENLDKNENLNHNEAEIDDSSNKLANKISSNVWKYFTKDANYKENKKAKCNHCGITYVCTGGCTTNLNKHIKSKHSGKTQEISIIDIFNTTAKVNI
jgi:radical SAM protein with 4Fe4S-binding SPASM domain